MAYDWKKIILFYSYVYILFTNALFIFKYHKQESLCAYVIIIMAIFWVTEALPIYVTALFPVFMFPLTGVLSAGDVGAAFFNVSSRVNPCVIGVVLG